MISIQRAFINDYSPIVEIGRVSVRNAHRDSCSEKDLDEFIAGHYNNEAIQKELSDSSNVYHIIKLNNEPAGFSKIIFNLGHDKISNKDVTKLDRIYLSDQFIGHGLGQELLKYNIDLAKQNRQSGIWLYTWTGNKRAIQFYQKMGFITIGSHEFRVSANHYNPNHQMLLSL